MRASLKLAGVDVVIARSWFVTQPFVAGACAWAAHALEPQLGAGAALVLGTAVAAALSASLLIHELAHAYVSIRAGMGIEQVRLFAAGALCRRRAPIEQPRDQFMVAAAGPLASVALGVLALAGAVVAEILALSGALSIALGFLAFANILIAASNMLPIFPFDGGKVVHAMFWRSLRDRRAASRRLRRSGQEFARVITGLGVVMIAWAGDLVLGLAISAFGVYLMFMPPPP